MKFGNNFCLVFVGTVIFNSFVFLFPNRYLYKKYHSNLTDNPGYGDPAERKVPLDDDGVEKGEVIVNLILICVCRVLRNIHFVCL